MTAGPGDALSSRNAAAPDASAAAGSGSPEAREDSPSVGGTAAGVPVPRDHRGVPPPPGPGPAPRPRIDEEPAILGLTRRSRSHVGSRLFTLFFVLVYAVILIQMIASILDPW